MILASPHLEPIEHPSEHLRQNLSTAVEGALWRYDPIRQTRTSIAVSEQDGVITLDGNIRGEMMKSVAGRIATGVTGVRRVINHLIADSEVEREISMSLAMDPEAEITTDKVSIRVILGQVVLGGRVFGATQAAADGLKARVEFLAAQVAGVQSLASQVLAIEGDEAAFSVAADVVVADDSGPKATGPRRMGTLIPDALKDKLRVMMKARAEARATQPG
ncbi:MAG: BON domain-containing protein [Anaerolineae bacterium]|jgi:osmotically-inducible protein OsmY|nr:BON domain-containing protein [Ardenticatenia bacterium]HQZ70491.1 BON domain-containing protein [Anaerolineae bacterium]